ncbi:MAG: GyrI-like domain-containing protein [Saprospiraceae bacterium]|nr:GyrI-like domain-containing protein [Saprospiraceae bacterium]
MSKKRLISLSFFGLISIFLIYLIVCYFSPKTLLVNDSIIISSTKGFTFLMLNDVREWKKWVSWSQNDPELQISLGGRFTNIGANFTFDGPEFGKGVVRLEEAHKDSIIVSYIKNSEWPSELATYWQIVPESKISLTLNTSSRLQNTIPFLKRPFYANLENRIKAIQRSDLESLKKHLESMINTEFGLSSTIFKSKNYIGIRTPIPNYQMQKYYGEKYPLIYKLIDSLHLEVDGPPVGMVFGWDGTNSIVDLMAALPVKEKMKAPLGFEFIEITDIPCLKLEHYGFYNSLKNAHARMDFVMNSSSYVLKAPIIEEYVTSPSQEKDTSKWLTNVYYLLNNEGSYAEGVTKKKTLEEMVNEQEKARKKKLGLIK